MSLILRFPTISSVSLSGSQPVLVSLYVTGKLTQLCHLCLTTSWGGLIVTTYHSLVVVVSPLISLMIDQVASLKVIESSASIATSGGSVSRLYLLPKGVW